ncbi:DUF3613 domain-containing protein [Cupriavidus sp. SW-Y-13]|uniref:DUF3613 domain-containing protein n=1 Tax=Cupriavidus sp. SW-Y-13 TaxID=2653854 RepID=UPI001F281106|nr:DUF3613 domain-containing protein [Cupriavidus sp. SW-Y-13]
MRHVSILAKLAVTVATAAASLAAGAQTTQAPQTETMPDASASQYRPNDVPVGDTTRNLLAIQRSGTQAGKMLPMTGEQAALGYARYMQSFNYALPEYFTSQSTGSPLRSGSAAQSINGR